MPEQKRDLSNLYTPLAIVLAGVIIGAFVMVGLSTSSGGGAPIGGQPLPEVDIADVNIAGRPFIGSADAPVTLAYWADHSCGFCAQFETQTLPSIVSQYVDTGQLKVVFKSYAFLGPDSTLAALWEEAVWELYPARHFEWRAATYRAHGQGSGEEHLVSVTSSVSGIDVARVQELVAQKGDEYQARVDADKAEGTAFGIQGTPGFITGKTLIPGALPLSDFNAAIDEQL